MHKITINKEKRQQVSQWDWYDTICKKAGVDPDNEPKVTWSAPGGHKGVVKPGEIILYKDGMKIEVKQND
jgi:hypothetical protein